MRRRSFLRVLGLAPVAVPVLKGMEWPEVAPEPVAEPPLPGRLTKLNVTDTTVSGDIANLPGVLTPRMLRHQEIVVIASGERSNIVRHDLEDTRYECQMMAAWSGHYQSFIDVSDGGPSEWWTIEPIPVGTPITVRLTEVPDMTIVRADYTEGLTPE